MSRKMYAMYHHEMGELAGTAVYLDINDNEVHVTGIDDNPECKNYHWDNKKLLGEVKKYLRNGRTGINQLEY